MYYLCNTLYVFHMFYFVLIVCDTIFHDPINNLGQTLNKLSFQLIVNVMNSYQRKKLNGNDRKYNFYGYRRMRGSRLFSTEVRGIF